MSIEIPLVEERASLARDFAFSRSASFAPAFALLMAPMAFAIAMTVDYSRKAQLTESIRSAADSALLAGARLNDADALRLATVQRYFDTQVPEVLKSKVSSSFTIDPAATKITGQIHVDIPTIFASILGSSASRVRLDVGVAIAKAQITALDVVMCIDATGSMSQTLNAVKTNATNFEANLNAELTKRGVRKFDLMRVRVIYYRDYGGNSNVKGAKMTVVDPSTGKSKSITTADPTYWNYVGDQPPLKASSFFPLPSQKAAFQTYVNPEAASGGGDLPESGLECVNEAMNSAWSKPGTTPVEIGKKLEATYPVIVVWTDAAAHRPSYSVSLKNPSYPVAADMPRNYIDLKKKWDNAAIINQNNKLLIFFGNPNLSSNDIDGKADGWQQLSSWTGFMVGGTLTQGNAQMVARLADAIASKVTMPTLTQ